MEVVCQLTILLCYCIHGAVETGICCICCEKEPEQAAETLITKEPVSEVPSKQIISQKVYNTTGIAFNNKMSTGFSNGFN